jgi:hypothetical protein
LVERLYAALTLVAAISALDAPRAGIVVKGPLNSSASANVSCTNALRRLIEAQWWATFYQLYATLMGG